MRKVYPVFFATMFMMTACRNQSSSEVAKKEDTTQKVAVKSMTSADEVTMKAEALKAKPQLTIEQLTAMLPAELNGSKQKNYSSGSVEGYPHASADYPQNNKAVVKIAVYDCAGEEGASFYRSGYADALNKNTENETEYTKTVDLPSGKAIEYYSKKANQSSLIYMVNDRVMVILKGRNMKPEELQTIAAGLNLKLS